MNNLKEEVQMEYGKFCNSCETCDDCKYQKSIDCHIEFIIDYLIDTYEIEKKDKLKQVIEDTEKYYKEFKEFCKIKKCSDCLMNNKQVSSSCAQRFIMGKERGIL